MRDALGQIGWQLCREQDFRPLDAAAQWDGAIHALMLASVPAALPEGVPPARSRNAANGPATAVDAAGGWARVVNVAGQARILAGGAVDPETRIWTGPAGVRISDIAVTSRDWLVICCDDGAVVIRDLSGRFAETVLQQPGFTPDRIIETVDGGLWLCDRSNRAMRRLTGDPLPERLRNRSRAGHVFHQHPADPDPLRFSATAIDLTAIPEEILDCCGLDDGRILLLCLGPRRQSSLRLIEGPAISERIETGLQSLFSIAPLSDGTFAALMPDAGEAWALTLAGQVLGMRLPLPRHDGGRFCTGPAGSPLRYGTTRRADTGDIPAPPHARLIAPSRPAYVRQARIRCPLIEADAAGTIWHRVNLDAQLPPGCGISLYLDADDDRQALESRPPAGLHPHHFGAAIQDGFPAAVWLDMDSERPFLPSATGCPRKRDRCGLFSVLMQKTGTTVRRLKGRWLRIDITLTGTGTASPRLHALRIWGGRQSWRDRFLPDYLSVEDGPLAAGSDFLERQLALFESILTPIEDEVAHSWRLTRPDAAPADALEWLAGWIGAGLDSALSDRARRRLLAQSVPLWRRRGTAWGLERVLDIVTDGAVARGEIVVLEHFHLRRTLATILGADLSDQTNPLTPWAAHSGNSHLGRSFILGDADRKAFFALFGPQLPDDPLTTADERRDASRQEAAFWDDHAHRVTVLVHHQIDEARRGLIARLLERELPAHVIGDIRQGPGTLVLALSSMLGVETRFGPAPPARSLTLGGAEIGQVFLRDTPALDPRFEGGA